MRSLLFTATLLIISASTALSQTAEVTLYSTGSISKALLVPYSKNAVFYGWLFDGTQKLGWIYHDQFMTLRLPAGHHSLSGGDSERQPPAAGALEMDLAKGEQRFIRLKSSVKNAVVYTTLTAELTEVPCATALLEAANAKPAKVKYVPKEVRSILSDSNVLPPCRP